MMKAAIAAVLITASLLLAACAPPPDREIRMGLASAPLNLDPRFATDAASARIGRLLYSRLVDFNDQFEPVPALADWEWLSAQRYRFRLLDQPLFADGSPLSVDDVIATYRFVLDPKNGSPHYGTLKNIERIERVDDRHLDFVLKQADALFPGYLTLGIVAANTPTGAVPPGSGAFRFVDQPAPNEWRIERVRDAQRIRFSVVKDQTVRVLKLRQSELDLIQNDLAPELIGHLREQVDIRVEQLDGINFSYLGLNLRHPALGKLRVRQAIAHAINREGLLKFLWQGGATPAESILKANHWAGPRGLTGYSFDPSRSRRLLAESGYGPERPLLLNYKTTTDAFRVRIATLLQAQLAEVGIELSIQSYDWGTFFGDVKAGRFDLYSLTWVGIKSPDIFRYVFHSESMPPNGANRGFFSDSRADRLIERASESLEPAEMGRLFGQLQAYLHAQLPAIPLWYETNTVAYGARVQGYRLHADGNYDGLLDIELIDKASR